MGDIKTSCVKCKAVLKFKNSSSLHPDLTYEEMSYWLPDASEAKINVLKKKFNRAALKAPVGVNKNICTLMMKSRGLRNDHVNCIHADT